MAVFTVINTADSGPGSLRQAVLDANAAGGADEIVFTAGLAGTITLTSGELALEDDVTINGDTNGDRKADITISGGGQFRIFKQDAAATGFGVALRSLTMINGYSEFQGGAIFVLGGTFSMTDSTVSGSTVGGGPGGGLYLDYTSATISNSLITGNTAFGKGGGIASYGGNTTILNTTIHGNQAGSGGGGIFKNNYATNTGGADIGDLTVVNSTITGNSSASGAGGINAGGEETIVNTVVAGNTLVGGGASDISGTLEIARNNVFGGTATVTTGSANQFNISNTGLGALADNGGPVLTRAIANLAGPLVNKGDTSAASYFGLTTDATGAPRVVGGTVDIGATESPLILVTTIADTVNAADGVISLREAVTLANTTAGSQTIRFASGLNGNTITLGSGLAITQGVVIDGDINGDDKADITISGANQHRIFTLSGGDTDLLSLALVNGRADDAITGNNVGAGDGGAIAVLNGSLDLVNSSIRASTAVDRGGGLHFAYGTTRIANSLIEGNTAGGNGGAMYGLFADGFTLANSTLHNNSAAGTGGGISVFAVTGVVSSSTITGNRAGTATNYTDRGGAFNFDNSPFAINNSVVGENTSGTANTLNDLSLYGAINAANFSIFSTNPDITTGNGNSTDTAGLGLGQLLDNGGSVLTRSPLDGSIAIAFGGNNALPLDVHDIDNDGNVAEELPRDGRGDLRVRDGSTDAGAVEQKVDETINGTAGRDTIIGGLGTDRLEGRGENDILDGGGGSDVLVGGGGLDTYLNVDASDTITEAAGAAGGFDTVRTSLSVYTLAANVERLYADTAAGFTGIGNAADNRIYGNNGADRFRDYDGGADNFSGGNGSDSMYFTGTAAAILNFATGVHGGSALGDAYNSIENYFGSNTGGDTMTAGAGRAIFNGQGGNDTLNGGANIDRLFGGTGTDTLNGGGGSDVLQGGAQNDTLTGGAARDYFVYAETVASGGWGADTVTDWQDGVDVLRFATAVADAFSDFAIANNNTASVKLTLIGAVTNTITLNGAGPIAISAADFLFF